MVGISKLIEVAESCFSCASASAAGLRARVEVALDPGLRGAQVLAVAGLVARQQRQARVEQAQAQVLAQEVGLRRRQQRRLVRADLAHHHQLAQLAPDLRAEARPEAAFVRRRSLAAAGRSLRSSKASGSESTAATRLSMRALMPATSSTGSAFRRSMSRASARRTGRNCGRSDLREARLGELQREQRGAHVAGELQLLRGDGEHLLDLGELPFVAVARQLLVQRLERELLALRFGEARLELRHLDVRLAQPLPATGARSSAPRAHRPRCRAAGARAPPASRRCGRARRARTASPAPRRAPRRSAAAAARASGARRAVRRVSRFQPWERKYATSRVEHFLVGSARRAPLRAPPARARRSAMRACGTNSGVERSIAGSSTANRFSRPWLDDTVTAASSPGLPGARRRLAAAGGDSS